MSFRLGCDTDSAEIQNDFGSGIERYRVRYYSAEKQLELLKKYGHRDSFFWKHKKTNVEVSKEPKDLNKYEQHEKVYAENEYDLTDENALKLRQESFNYVLLSWEDSIQDENGNPVECGKKEKNQLVIDSFVRVFWITIQAGNIFMFLPDMEQVSKNSSRPLDTKKSTEEAKSNSQIAEPVSV